MVKITQWVKIIIICFLFGFTTQLYSFNSPRNNLNENYDDGICYVFSEAPPINQFGFNIRNNVKFSNAAAALTITITEITAATCSNRADGSLKATAYSGQAPYSYSWTGPESFTANTATINKLKPGNYTVKATDVNNVFLSKSHTISFEDLQSPTITAPAAVTANTDSGKCTAFGVNLGTPTTSDNCDVKSVTNNAPSTFPLGVTSVIWTVTDNSDNKTTATHTVTINDIQNPTITAPANVSANTDSGKCTASGVNLGTPTTSDNCSVKSVTNNAPSTFPLGVTSVIWTVTDDSDNKSTATHTVTINDIQNPTITAPANVSIDTDSGKCTASGVNLGTPTTSDNCGVKSFSNNAPSIFPLGETSVTWTVLDNSDNEATTTQTVTVKDIQNPTITAPSNVSVDTDSGKCTASEVNLGTPTTSDNCGVKSFNNNAPSIFSLGDTSVTWTVIDDSDNETTAIQTVTVNDNEAPLKPNLADIDNWSCGKQITDFPVSTDNCENIITGTTTNNLQFDTFGEYSVTWTFTDNSSNITTAVQKIVIPEPTVDIPSINGNEFCNENIIPAVAFSGNDLENKRYEWSYKSNTNSSIDIGLATSGTGNIPEFTSKNNGSNIIEAVFTVIPFGNSCKGKPVEFSIFVKPTPTMTKPEPIVVCSGGQVDQINFPDNIFSVPNSSVTWTNDNTEIGLGANGNGNIASFTATNSGPNDITAIISVTPSANSCDGISQTFKITVKPTPAITNSLENKTYCNGKETELIPLQSNVNGTTFNISGGSVIGLANRTNATEIPSFITKAGAATITVTPIANGCHGDPVTYSILVNPTPTLSVNPSSQAICSGGTTAINLSGSGQSYSWILAEVGSNITGAEDGAGNTVAQILTNSGTVPQVVKYKIVPESNECLGTPITVTITVNPIPEFEINIPACQPSIDLTNPTIKSSTFTGLTYTYWSNPEATSQIQNPTAVGLGTYYIKGKSSSGCSLVKEVIINNIKPVLSTTLTPADICSNTVFNYLPESDIVGTTYSWSRAVVSGISNPEDSSTEENKNNPNEILNNTTTNSIQVTYIYTLTSSSGCTNIQEVKVNVKPTPMLEQQAYTSELCSGDLFEYSPKSTLGGTNYKWERRDANGNIQSSGTGAISERLNNETENNSVFTYYFTLKNSSCENSEEFKVPVTILPTFQVKASFSPDEDITSIEICPGESIGLFSSTELTQDLQEILLSEDFNSSTNWSPNTAGSANWSRQNNYNPPEGGGIVNSSSGNFAVANKFNLNPNSNISESNLISPAFSTQGYTSLTLNFRHFYRDVGESWGDFAVIDYSLDNGASWNVYEFFNNSQGSPNNFNSFSDQISEIIGHDQVRIRFRFLNQGNNARGYTWAFDDVTITGEIQSAPEVEWTSSTDENWTSNEQNPTNITPGVTTVYTVKYTDPDLECPGRASIEVIVKDPPTPKIIADYCAFPNDPNKIKLYVDGIYDEYYWSSSGQPITGGREIIVTRAQGYTVRVVKNGCEGTASITISQNLVINGNFDDPQFTLPYSESSNSGSRNIKSNNTSLFTTRYNFKVNPSDTPNQFGALGPEGTMAVGDNAGDYHNNFTGKDHTTGTGNFLIVNGDANLGQVVWETSGYLNIKQNTNYYFNAWTSNIDRVNTSRERNFAKLRLQVFVEGNNNPVIQSTLGNLYNNQTGQGVAPGTWIEFYNPSLWNSGNNSKVKLRIINEENEPAGNDFGIDDISFAEISSVDFDFAPSYDPICENEDLQLYANLEGGREPITFSWTTTSPNGFTSSEENPIIPNATIEDNGTYSLVITDFYGCRDESKPIDVNIQKVDAGEGQTLCSNIETIQLNGVLSGTTAGGTWSGGAGTFSNNTALDAIYTPNQKDIDAKSVILTLTSNDSNATCTDQVTINFNNAPIVTTSVTPVTCFGANDGTASVSINEGTGTAPFTYEWRDGSDENGTIIQTTQTATGLAPNPDGYTVTVTDANSCSISLTSDAILEPTKLEIVGSTIIDATCFGGENGEASLEVTGGFITGQTPDYSFSLLDKEGNEVFTKNDSITVFVIPRELLLLSAGVYTFTANTTNNCSLLSETITIDQPLEIIVDAGEDINIIDCGITSVNLNAIPVDPELGKGEWSFISRDGGTGNFDNKESNSTIFHGDAEKNYILIWTVSPINDECVAIESPLPEFNFPPACSKLNFDGVDDYVNAGDHYAMGTSAFSVEAWVKPNAISGVNTILSKRVAGDPILGYDLFLNNGAPSFRVSNKTVTSTKVINTDRWYHIAGVYTNSKLSIYVDGIELQNNSNSIPVSGDFSAPFLIGATHDPTEAKLTKDHFNGFIEEVRIWGTGIQPIDIQFLMNQRIKVIDNISPSAPVEGEIVPHKNYAYPDKENHIDAEGYALYPTNECKKPDCYKRWYDRNWGELLGYYQLLAQDHLISSGKTPNLGSKGTVADGLLKNIQLMQENTAPLPYILNSVNGNWFEKSTWRLPTSYNGISINRVDVWNAPGSKGINGDVITWNIVKLNGKSANNSVGNNIQLLALLDDGGSLDMEGNNQSSGSGLTISHYLKLDGKIDLNGESQLVQTEGSILDETSAGIVEKDQQGTANSFNYNYWSSPVSIQGAANNSGYSIKQVMLNGTNSSSPIPMTFVNGPYGADDAGVNITNYWLHKFRGTASIYSEWKYVGSTGKLETGEGFTMKGTSGNAAIQDRQNYTYSGKPNNGNLLLNIGKDQNYLLGNPYPSSINAYQFIKDNIAVNGGTHTQNIFNGALYFWDHFASGDTHNLAEYVGGYATLSLAGGVPAISNDVRINNNNAKGTKIPRQYIPVAQGFFINTTLDPEIAKTVNITVDGGDVVFKNGQRAFVKESETANSQFLSQEKPKIKGEDKSNDTRSKIRLVYESPKGFNRQILVTADENTTNDFDLGYDALLNDAISEDMYWVINEKEFVIQGIPNFNKDQELPLGVKLKEKGEFVIKIHELENIKDDAEIYLKNIADSTYHDLRAADFTTTLDGGTYNKKYVLVFHKPKNPDSGTDGETDGEPDPDGDGDETVDPTDKLDLLSNLDVVYASKNRELTITNPDNLEIRKVTIYNLLGQKIQEYEDMGNKKLMTLGVKEFPTAVYVVKMHSEIGEMSKNIVLMKN